jgi:hypothetical protein
MAQTAHKKWFTTLPIFTFHLPRFVCRVAFPLYTIFEQAHSVSLRLLDSQPAACLQLSSKNLYITVN